MTTRFQETLAAVCDAIQMSHKISSSGEASPVRYRLLTTRSNLEKDGSVRKWTFGQRNINMQNKILLIVGETGTGKTTLINAMVNYILGVKFTDKVWFEITEEGGDKQMSDQSQSQTSEITVYEVFAQDNQICLTIIDTPGYGDIRGTDMDKQIAEKLYKLFRSDPGVKTIDAVCLVIKASENRLNDRQLYIFDAVFSVFGKDIENNIVVFFTHSDGFPPSNALNAIKTAGVPCRKNKKNEPEYFLFNNHQNEQRDPKYDRMFQRTWEDTEESLNNFFASLKEENRKSLEQTENVLTESIRLKACIFNLQNRIDFEEGKAEELTQFLKALEENQDKIKNNQNFTFTVTKQYKEKILIENASWWNRKATTCSVCEENCHEYGCWSALNAGWCEVMKEGHCTSCHGKCHHSKHVRENKKYITCKKPTAMTYYELKKQYESSSYSSDIKFGLEVLENVTKKVDSIKIEQEMKENVEKGLKEDLTKTEKIKAELVEEACNSIIKLFEIALKPDSAFIVQALDFLIPKAEETGKPVHAHKLRELKKIQPESQDRVNAVIAYAKAGVSHIKNVVTGKK